MDGKVVAVAIDDEARDAIGLGPDEASEVEVDAGVAAVFDGLADAADEEIGIEVLSAARESTSDDLRLGVIDRGAERAVAKVFESDDIARSWVSE